MIALDDTNILVHAHRKDAGLHVQASERVRKLAEDPAPWAICFHTLVEFYGISSHAKIWSTPSVPAQADDRIAAWRESPSLRILVERPGDIQKLMTLATGTQVTGPKIHDARIASCCLLNGIRELWTIERDFSRFPSLQTKNPLMTP